MSTNIWHCGLMLACVRVGCTNRALCSAPRISPCVAHGQGGQHHAMQLDALVLHKTPKALDTPDLGQTIAKLRIILSGHCSRAERFAVEAENQVEL
jgi:hypothetical protein